MKLSTATFILLLVFCENMFSQITPLDQNTDDRIDTTNYINNITGNDPIFIYYSPRGEWTELGQLKASVNGFNKLNFRWYMFNYDANPGFNILIQSNDSTEFSTLANVNQGGYRVHIYNADVNIDTNFYCWVFFNRFSVGDISVENSTCKKMTLKTNITFDTFFKYRDRIEPDKEITYENNIESKVWTDNPESGTLIPGTENPSFDAPTVETKYTLTVTDKFGTVRSNSRSIWAGDDDGRGNLHLKAVKADFVGIRGETEYIDSIIGQAPLNAVFQNKSENAVAYEWVFYKHPDWRQSTTDTLLYSFNIDEITDSLTFVDPRRNQTSQPGHNILLKAYGPVYTINNQEFQCIDTILKEDFIIVESTYLPLFVNVFSPESPFNNLFHFENFSNQGSYKPAKSIKEFSIKIYNRWGARVYYYDGPVTDWQGWDGTSFSGAGKVPSGVYYYVAHVVGYDGLPIADERITGFVHVFRGN